MLVAITLFIIIYAASIYYTANASDTGISQLQMISLASDIVTVMDYNNTLKTLDINLITKQRDELLPSAYAMRINIETHNNVSLDTGNIQPGDRFVGSGKRYFISGQNYGEADYWIWARE